MLDYLNRLRLSLNVKKFDLVIIGSNIFTYVKITNSQKNEEYIIDYNRQLGKDYLKTNAFSSFLLSNYEKIKKLLSLQIDIVRLICNKNTILPDHLKTSGLLSIHALLYDLKTEIILSFKSHRNTIFSCKNRLFILILIRPPPSV